MLSPRKTTVSPSRSANSPRAAKGRTAPSRTSTATTREIGPIIVASPSTRPARLRIEGPDAHLSEIDLRPLRRVVVVLEAEVARFRARAPLRLVVLLPLGDHGGLRV